MDDDEKGFYRIHQIVLIPGKTVGAPLLPISRTTFWRWVKEGKAPQPVKLGRMTMWEKQPIGELVRQISSGELREPLAS